MTSDQIALLYFGIPLAVFGLGLRRRMGAKAALLVVPVSLAIAVYGLGLEWFARELGLGLPVPVRPGSGPVRSFAPFAVFAVLLGAYGAALVRFRRGADDQMPPSE